MLDFLVPVHQALAWRGPTHYAASLAALVRGFLTGLYAHESLTDLPLDGPPALRDDVVEFLRERLAEALRAGPDFRTWAGGLGVTDAHWRVAQTCYRRALRTHAAWHDILVLPADPAQEHGTPDRLSEMLVELGTPCLVVPDGVSQASLSTVVLAWNGSLESTRAIRRAMPLLAHADRIVLLRARSPRREGVGSLEDIGEFLRRHGFAINTVYVDVEDREAGAAILAMAAGEGADLLVMGAYGRSRLGEWLMGGATHYVLHHARLPVLFHH